MCGEETFQVILRLGYHGFWQLKFIIYLRFFGPSPFARNEGSINARIKKLELRERIIGV